MFDYNTQVDQLIEIAEKNKNSRAVNTGKFLKQRIANPESYVVCVGESCSGKSTIINGIIGKEVLPVSGVPSTASITEICFDKEVSEDCFYAINKDATMEALSKDTFEKFALDPDEKLERLRYVTHSDDDWSGLKIFDTPGYGSLVEEHEEVLMEFLPNCDAILYTVSYRIGVQDEDYAFLQSLSDLTRCGIPFCLIINRCPEGIKEDDIRIQEIYGYVTGLLEKTSVPLVLIESVNTEENEILDVNDIRKFIFTSANSADRENELDEAFKGYVTDLCDMVEGSVDTKLACAELSKEEQQANINATKEYISVLRKAKDEIIIPEFDKLKDNFEKHAKMCSENLKNDCIEDVKKQNILKKEETKIFITEYLLKRNGKKQADELQFFLENELNAIDRKLNDYLNKAIVKIQNDLKIQNVSQAAIAGFNIMKGQGRQLVEKGLLIYFSKFGGRGGASAGIANAASHMLKKFGDAFGKTFSRETHNGLKHIIAKVGLTSTRTLAVSATVIIDTVVFTVDMATWKLRLNHEISKAAKKWYEDVKSVTIKDIDKLKEQNINDLEDLANMVEEELQPIINEEFVDLEELKKQKEVINEIKRSVA